MRELSSISPHSSRIHRNNPSRVVQKDRSCQPEFFLRGLPFLRWIIYDPPVRVQLRYEAIGGVRWRARRTLGATLAGVTRFGWRTPSVDRDAPRTELSPSLSLTTAAERFDKMPLSP